MKLPYYMSEWPKASTAHTSEAHVVRPNGVVPGNWADAVQVDIENTDSVSDVGRWADRVQS